MTAIQHRHRQKIDERQIDGKQHHKVERRRKPMLGNLPGHMGYPGDSADLACGAVAADDLSNDVEDGAG